MTRYSGSKKLKSGDRVKLVGRCKCSERPLKDAKIFEDIRDCYHKDSTVIHAFRDGTSVWLNNSYGYSQRFMNVHLKAWHLVN
jgi:hypothetical protein